MKTPLLFLCLTLSTPLCAAPVISEFMGKNKTTIADENGDYSDWVEIFNPDPAPVSLNQWYLTDSASNLKKWRFPDVTLAPGECLLVWASGKNRRVPGLPLHTSYSLDGDGEYLALVKPDGATVQQEFAPKFPAQGDDQSYGLLFNSTTLLPTGASARYKSPASVSDVPANWQATTFNDSSWASGPTGFGHGLLIPGITLKQTLKNGGMGGNADADTLLALPDGHPLILRTATTVVQTVNTLGDGPEIHFSGSYSPPAGAADNYAMRATGYVTIPSAGYYTFGMSSDDGGYMKIDGTLVINHDYGHPPTDFFATLYLSAGLHAFDVLMFELGGGDELEFFAAPGQYGSFDSSAFKLVGDTAHGGLAASTLPPASGGLVGTNTESTMAGKTSLLMRHTFDAPPVGATALSLITRHNDGFTAWLNGTAAASDRAPSTIAWDSVASSSRTNADSLVRQGHNLTNQLSSLAATGNILAIQGLKTNPDDVSFLMVPELMAGSLDPSMTPVFYRDGKATPGYLNGPPSSLGSITNLSFSVPRGFYNAPFSVAITTPTPGATIRYTTDGSTPTATAGTLYTGPVAIASTTVLRACATKQNWDSSAVATQTYLFTADIVRQSPNGEPPAGWPTTSGTSQVMDYGMDPDVVNSPNPDIGGESTIESALTSIPTLSLVTDLPNLLNIGESQGIYSNPDGHGLSWERKASIEWILPPDATHPNGADEFQIDAGARIRGGFSRSTSNPKHSFRLFFRKEYGAGKLNYPLFGRKGAQEFDKMDLRTAQNYSWSFEGDSRNTFLREESSRQTMVDMKNPSSHVRYFHLYLNGQYWGLYNFDERTEADFSASYMGGTDEDWDVLGSERTDSYTTRSSDGNLDAWRALWDLGKIHRATPSNANYFKMMGLAADGVTATTDPVLLDADNLIDYLMLTFWMGNLDGTTSIGLGNAKSNNWSCARQRVNNPRRGFCFYVHDFEHSMLNADDDRTGPYTFDTESDFNFSNPLFLHQDLVANEEYRIHWADRIHKHMFGSGALTPQAWQNRLSRLAAVVDQSIAAESARWGDARREAPMTRLNWISTQNDLLNYIAVRNPIVLSQLKADNLYPSVDAPVLAPENPYQANGSEVTISGPAGSTLYYMADGSDPRAVGGAVKAGAQTYVSSTVQELSIPWSAGGWKYLADGSNQGAAWREESFNDSAWPTGAAELGYGDGDETTVIPIVDVDPATSGVQKAATYYFRKTFDIATLANITNMKVTVKYDDAYAVYLNGVRVAGNLPPNPAYNYYTNSLIEDTIAETSIDFSTLHTGSNTLAVEIHQATNTSTDLSMNCSVIISRSNTPNPLYLTGSSKTLRFRAKNGSTWSALSEATYLLDTEAASPANLAISKIMYHPADPTTAEIAAGYIDSEDFEYIELLNTGSKNVDLEGVYLEGAVSYDFINPTSGRLLAPGGRVLVVANTAAFIKRYGTGKPIAGEFDGKLSDSGETVILRTPGEALIRSVTYYDSGTWPSAADGDGAALVARYPGDPTSDSIGEAWRGSGTADGNPGSPDAPAAGSFDHWAATAFDSEQMSSSLISALSADPDGDGRDNFQEFAQATNPLSADLPVNLFTWSSDETNRLPALKFRRPQGALGVTYELQAGNDLSGWSTVSTTATETTALGNGVEEATFCAPTAGAVHFLRLRISPKP